MKTELQNSCWLLISLLVFFMFEKLTIPARQSIARIAVQFQRFILVHGTIHHLLAESWFISFADFIFRLYGMLFCDFNSPMSLYALVAEILGAFNAVGRCRDTFFTPGTNFHRFFCWFVVTRYTWINIRYKLIRYRVQLVVFLLTGWTLDYASISSCTKYQVNSWWSFSF